MILSNDFYLFSFNWIFGGNENGYDCNIKNKVEADLVFEDVKYVVKDHELDKFVSLKTKKQRFWFL